MTDNDPGPTPDYSNSVFKPNESMPDLHEISTSRAARALLKIFIEDEFEQCREIVEALGRYTPAVMAELGILMDRMRPRFSGDLLRFVEFHVAISPPDARSTEAFLLLCGMPDVHLHKDHSANPRHGASD